MILIVVPLAWMLNGDGCWCYSILLVEEVLSRMISVISQMCRINDVTKKRLIQVMGEIRTALMKQTDFLVL